MAIVTTTAIATITNKIVNAGLQMAKGLTLDPIRQGFGEYESLLTKQNVIMNATGKSAGEVKKVLNDLNKYSDKTIFSFGDMTEALTSFVNAGVDLKSASKAMQGIANASALAGASTQESQSSFRAFSQALGQGFLGLQDWRQAAVTGKIGTVQFKQALIDAAVAQGTLTKKGDEYITKSGKALTATKGFDLSLQEQWANTEVLNKALGTYGDQTTKTGKKAFKAAQDVRTFSAFMSTFKESLGSGWSQIFTTTIGGLTESTALWTGLSNTVGKASNTFFNFLNTTLMTFKALGGFGKIGESFRNIWAPIAAIFTTVGAAWRQAFPDKGPGSGQVLFNIANGFAKMTAPLQTVAEWITKLTPYLAGFFKVVAMGAGGLGIVVSKIAELTKSLVGLINIDVPSAGGGISSFFEKILGGVEDLYHWGLDAATQLVDGIVAGFTNGSVDTAGTLLGTGLLGAIFLVLKKGINFNFGDGLLGNINVLEQMTNTFQAMQTNLQAKTLMSIAGAIALITASVVALSFIDADKLKKSLFALSVGFTQLLGAMAILVKISGSAGFVKVPLIAASMVLLATSITILVGAIALMGQLKWETIGKGLAGIAGALVVIAGAMQLMPVNMPITAAGLVLVSVALNAIAGAIAIMGNLEWSTIGKGLVTIAGSLVIIAGAMQLMPVNMPITAAGLVLVGIALNGIAAALKIMGTMSWKDIGQGLTALGGAMAILALGLNAMSGTALGSASLLIAAGAINILTPALLLMSKMSWEGIAKSMVALAGGMAILAIGLTAMAGALPGAAALLVVSPALLALSTALLALSTMSWEDLGKALVALAAGLTVIGLAGLLIGPVVPALLGLGAALLLMGAGLALAGAGILAFSTALGLLVAMGAGAISYLKDFLQAFFDMLPGLGKAFGLLIGQFAVAIQEQTPVIVAAITTMVLGLIAAAQKIIPKLGPVFTTGIRTALNVIKKAIPDYVKAGADVVIGVLKGLGSKVGKMADAAGDLIANFITGVADQAGKIADSAAKAVITFLDSMATAIDDNSEEMGSAMGNLGVAMVKGLIKGIASMAGEAIGSVKDLAGNLAGAAKKKLSIFSPSKVFVSIGKFLVMGLTQGIQNNAAAAITSVATMVSGQIAVANEYISKYIQDLDQKAIAALAKADGLAAAAKKAQQYADKTKSKKDDKAADKLSDKAEAADKAAEKAVAKANAAKAKQDRDEEFKKASLLGKAQMKSEDAQKQLDAAKLREQRAAAKDIQADALDKQAKASGVTAAQRKALRKQADALRKQAIADAKAANDYLDKARKSAADALDYQKQAGDEAAAAYQKIYEAEAKSDADEKAFNKLSDAEKAKQRQQQAIDLQKKADEDLAAAKKLAYTDLEAANDLAEKAMDEADQARKYLEEATNLANGTAGGSLQSGSVVNLDPTEAAAIAMNQYSDLFDSATAAASTTKTVEFKQYNTSPVPLNPTEVYRQTNNLFTYAVDKLDDAAA